MWKYSIVFLNVQKIIMTVFAIKIIHRAESLNNCAGRFFAQRLPCHAQEIEI